VADEIGKPEGLIRFKKCLKRQISTPCGLRKCSSSSFLPRTPSAFQQARRRALHRSVLGRAAIFGHEETHGLQDSPQVGCPRGEGRDGREEPTGQLHTCLEGEAIEIRDILEWGGGRLGGDHQFGVVRLAAAVLTLAAAFFFGFPAAGLGPAIDFGLRLLRPGHLPGGGHFRLLGRLRDRLR
jgi:hypothetical protein